ncbi:MAG: oligopeptide/dipeptide ABC transporter ATP-binding protein, partial [Bacillota bacterium]
NALHPYSQGLLRSTLDVGAEDARLQPIPGNPPNLLAPPPGCRFHPHCTLRQPICEREQPALRPVGGGHEVACHLVQGGAPHV